MSGRLSGHSRPWIGVLGPVLARSAADTPQPLGGPRHAEVLARLVAAGGAAVPVRTLVEELWDDPPAGAVAAVRTFVAALRRALEPGRAARSPAQVIVTAGSGYRLSLPRDHVDAWHFEDLVRTAAGSERAGRLRTALDLWRGPAYADYADRGWATGAIAKLTELRCVAVETLAETEIRNGRPELAIAELEEYLPEHPGRERAWLLQARALNLVGRREEALALLRRARVRLVSNAGLDSSAELIALESEILGAERDFVAAEDRLWSATVTAYGTAGRRSRITSAADLLRGLALTDAAGLITAQDRRSGAIGELESFDDPELTATALTRMEVPGVWSRLDDPARSARVVAAARATLDTLEPDTSPALRARLLALVAIESRGRRGASAAEAARAAEVIARELGDPGVLVLALDARFLQSFHSVGGWPERATLGAELIEVSRRHDLSTYLILGHLIALQAAAARGDVRAADTHADTADRLAQRYERDLVSVFTTWYRALRTVLAAASDRAVAAAYERAFATLPGCGMPGVADGLAPLTRVCLALRGAGDLSEFAATDFGPNAPYIAPLLAADPAQAAVLLHAAPAPPPDHLAELCWALLGIAAHRIGDRDAAGQAYRALAPARAELLGAGTGMVTLGPAAALLDRLRETAFRE
ncbi:AfsR/SARP family transcriptional regulator [Nocardia vermiculata]|uniref:AfsR/SARP family transcriptional regulator n=1 Tax=Nocardia vermiculata TaxID=257274 RepID=A0A846Y0L3_9NOCA|nr:BTAD domain-containing putative transcriptional regulator [Nocardia vermiculata]NKY50818.1 AfsR/SARP family transcriptional regulator [Nocardia vermiculata]